MYNRYIPNQQGGYTRIPQEDSDPISAELQSNRDSPPTKSQAEHRPPPAPPSTSADTPLLNSSGGRPTRITDSLTAFLRHGLDQLHLDHVDTGDLLLLGLLFFLFRENADEELLVALGLLLIL